jgi:hypothetical protein
MSEINKARYIFGPPTNPEPILPSALMGDGDGCGCPSCLDYPCINNYVGSFDQDGNYLIPSGWVSESYSYWAEGDSVLQPSGSFIGWENEAAPSSVHPIPCYYKITIDGVENNDVTESWCQQCDSLNNEYYAVRDTEPYTLANYQPDRIINIPLCHFGRGVSYCYLNNLEVYLSIGTEQYPTNIEYSNGLNPLWLTTDSSIAPYYDDDSSYIYRNFKKTEEQRPQLYIYAIARIVYDQEPVLNYGG